MRKNIDAQDLANEILMDKKNPIAYLYVEGESDIDFFSKFIDNQKCLIRATNGNPILIETLDILVKHNAHHQVLGVIDADFRRIDGNLPTHENIFLTDTHDLETMIMQSETLELIVNKFCRKRGKEAQKDAYLQAKGQTLRKFLTTLALPIAHFKYLSDTKNYGFKFKRNPLDRKDERPDYKKFIDKESMRLQVGLLILELKNCSQNNLGRGIDNKILEKEITETAEKLASFDVWEVCNGHHITNILSVALLKALSDYNSYSSEVDSKLIENELITNYDSMYFKNTNLYKSLKNWEATHVIIFKEF